MNEDRVEALRLAWLYAERRALRSGTRTDLDKAAHAQRAYQEGKRKLAMQEGYL